jgi:hypothetical protein
MQDATTMKGYQVDRELEDMIKAELAEAGYSAEHIERVLSQQQEVMSENPLFFIVHSRYMSPDTLDAYHIPWQWDDEIFLAFLCCNRYCLS